MTVDHDEAQAHAATALANLACSSSNQVRQLEALLETPESFPRSDSPADNHVLGWTFQVRSCDVTDVHKVSRTALMCRELAYCMRLNSGRPAT